jgi:hypothetical protein
MYLFFPTLLGSTLHSAAHCYKGIFHYYIIAKVHHIQAWLNGVQTIDTTHAAGFEEGAIGFQLCHSDKHTILDVRSLYIKEIKQ